MKLNFPKIIKKIDLGEYAAEMKGQAVSVWVNPPSGDLHALGDFYNQSLKDDGEEAKAQYLELLSNLLSQRTEDTYSPADLEELEKAAADTDPAFWIWFQNRVITEINDHRLGRKKD